MAYVIPFNVSVRCVDFEARILDSPDCVFDALDSLELERPLIAGVAHAGEIETLLVPTSANLEA